MGALDHLVTIASFQFPFQAEVLALRLEAEGIAVLIHNKNHLSPRLFSSITDGNVEVKVNPSQEADARAIVAMLDAKVEPSVELHDALQVDGQIYDLVRGICPNCEKAAVYLKRDLPKMPGTIGIAETIINHLNKKYFCYNCHHEWED
jgi:hypothetical protein